jgi:hypothetical protein
LIIDTYLLEAYPYQMATIPKGQQGNFTMECCYTGNCWMQYASIEAFLSDA